MATIQDIAASAGVSTSTVSKVLHGHPGVSDRTRQTVIEVKEKLDQKFRKHAVRPTIKDVATLAGVSIASVSNVINDRPAGDKTREVVLSAIEELQYTPNKIGRDLKKDKGNTIIIASTVPIPKILQGVYAGAHEFGYDISLVYTGISNQEDVIHSLEFGSACGVIFINCDDIQLLRFLSQKYDVVQCGEYVDEPRSNIVSLDYENAAYQMTVELLKSGRRRIRFLTSYGYDKRIYNYAQQYEKGFIHALKEYGLDHQNAEIIDLGQHAYSSNYSAHDSDIKNMLKSPVEKRPDALLCISTLVALIYVYGLNSGGVSIPSDIAVASLDSEDYAKLCCPNITAIHQPAFKLGYEAVKCLADRLSGTENGPQKRLFGHIMKLRGSTHDDLGLFGELSI